MMEDTQKDTLRQQFEETFGKLLMHEHEENLFDFSVNDHINKSFQSFFNSISTIVEDGEELYIINIETSIKGILRSAVTYNAKRKTIGNVQVFADISEVSERVMAELCSNPRIRGFWPMQREDFYRGALGAIILTSDEYFESKGSDLWTEFAENIKMERQAAKRIGLMLLWNSHFKHHLKDYDDVDGQTRSKEVDEGA